MFFFSFDCLIKFINPLFTIRLRSKYAFLILQVLLRVVLVQRG